MKTPTVVRLFGPTRGSRQPIGMSPVRFAPRVVVPSARSEIRTVQNQAYALLMDTLDWLFCECYTSIEINTLKSPAGLYLNETIARLWMLQTVKVQDAPRNKRHARRS